MENETINRTIHDIETQIFREIDDKKFKRLDIARTYGLLCRQPMEVRNAIRWPSINAAIIERWSMSGLIYIKEQAWKLVG